MLGDLPIFTVLKARMQYQEARQRLLAENVANADTPGYRAKDLRSFDAKLAVAGDGAQGAGLAVTLTSAAHIPSAPMEGGFGGLAPVKGRPFETVPSGNAVNLEDEMMKLARNQADYQAATTLYAKSLGLLKTAIGKR